MGIWSSNNKKDNKNDKKRENQVKRAPSGSNKGKITSELRKTIKKGGPFLNKEES